jgi:hypothetical protein
MPPADRPERQIFHQYLRGLPAVTGAERLGKGHLVPAQKAIHHPL